MKTEFYVEGTTCDACRKSVVKAAMSVHGVKKADFDLATGKGYVVSDRKPDMDAIAKRIEDKGYTFGKPQKRGYLFAILGLAVIAFSLYLSRYAALPEIAAGMGLGLVFVAGLLTGLHCIAMCGGFVVSYTAKATQEKSSLLAAHLKYAGGKTLSYTLIGGLFGALGSVVAFTPQLRGMAGVLAGLFLLIFGFRMLGVKFLSRFSLKAPGPVERIAAKLRAGPFSIGLANGLMIACGPLQAMYIMAAGTGSMLEGAKYLLVFGLGTLPFMMGFGAFASLISRSMTSRIAKVSGLVVLVLGVMMLKNGLALTGVGIDVGGPASEDEIDMNDGYQEIRMDVTARGWSPASFVLKKDVPVRWVIDGKQITGCNNAIVVPKLGLEFPIKPGEQVIEFTPTEAGTIPWSCWMGMIQGRFIVTDDPGSIKEDALPAPAAGAAGTCHGPEASGASFNGCQGGNCGGGCAASPSAVNTGSAGGCGCGCGG